jgi:hypothetical protein
MGTSAPPDNICPAHVTKFNKLRVYHGQCLDKLRENTLTSFHDHVVQLPDNYSWCLKGIPGSSNNYQHIIWSIQYHRAVVISDGSFKEEARSCVWVLEGDHPTGRVISLIQVPGAAAEQSAWWIGRNSLCTDPHQWKLHLLGCNKWFSYHWYFVVHPQLCPFTLIPVHVSGQQDNEKEW